jgi:cytoskeleton protein RodZ
MAESIGARLRNARLAKGLTLEDVAQSTCIRPEKLEAIEKDDYSGFPSMAYSRGFLTMYGKHLGVDVSSETRSMEGHSAIHLKEYQYLKNAQHGPLPEDAVAPRERSPSIVPLLVFGGIILLVSLIGWVLLNIRRLGLG